MMDTPASPAPVPHQSEKDAVLPGEQEETTRKLLATVDLEPQAAIIRTVTCQPVEQECDFAISPGGTITLRQLYPASSTCPLQEGKSFPYIGAKTTNHPSIGNRYLFTPLSHTASPFGEVRVYLPDNASPTMPGKMEVYIVYITPTPTQLPTTGPNLGEVKMEITNLLVRSALPVDSVGVETPRMTRRKIYLAALKGTIIKTMARHLRSTLAEYLARTSLAGVGAVVKGECKLDFQPQDIFFPEVDFACVTLPPHILDRPDRGATDGDITEESEDFRAILKYYRPMSDNA